jgi:hypothetical protein
MFGNVRYTYFMLEQVFLGDVYPLDSRS